MVARRLPRGTNNATICDCMRESEASSVPDGNFNAFSGLGKEFDLKI
jgi:hypothetical protein